MKKRILAVIFAAAIIASAMSGCKKVEQDTEKELTLDERVQVIADNINIWKFDKTAYEGQNVHYNYCITDLDGNGRLELITAVEVRNAGYQNFDTKIKYYELNEDNTALLTLECVSDSKSQPDVCEIIDTVNKTDSDSRYCYKDSSGRAYYVVCDSYFEENADGTKNQHVSKVAMSIHNGKAYEETLATYSIIREAGKDAVEQYTDGDGNVITKEAFDKIESTRFKGYTVSTFKFGWQMCAPENFDTEFNPASDVFIKKLAASYEAFTKN